MSAIIGIAALGSFTFHYVSINTIAVGVSIATLTAFTFHYVSINTPLKFQLLFLFVSLHSTMFLLIPRPLHTIRP